MKHAHLPETPPSHLLPTSPISTHQCRDGISLPPLRIISLCAHLTSRPSSGWMRWGGIVLGKTLRKSAMWRVGNPSQLIGLSQTAEAAFHQGGGQRLWHFHSYTSDIMPEDTIWGIFVILPDSIQSCQAALVLLSCCPLSRCHPRQGMPQVGRLSIAVSIFTLHSLLLTSYFKVWITLCSLSCP